VEENAIKGSASGSPNYFKSQERRTGSCKDEKEEKFNSREEGVTTSSVRKLREMEFS